MAEYKPVRKIDLTALQDLNRTSVRGKRVPWQKRVDVIFKQFPTSAALSSKACVPDWRRAFDKDIDLFAWILRDVLKADGATPGRSGPKPTVDRAAGAVRLRQLMGDDYTVLPFHEAFRILAGDESLTRLSERLPISRTQINRLMKGTRAPTGWEMEAIAALFDIPPGYFAEYRLGVVVAAIVDKLEKYPDATVKYWREITMSEMLTRG